MLTGSVSHFSTIWSHRDTVPFKNVEENSVKTVSCFALIVAASWKHFTNCVPKSYRSQRHELRRVATLTESNDSAEVPAIPVIVQCFTPCGRSHLLHAWGQRICMRPADLNLLAACLSGTQCISQTEISPTLLSVAIYVPAWYNSINLSI